MKKTFFMVFIYHKAYEKHEAFRSFKQMKNIFIFFLLFYSTIFAENKKYYFYNPDIDYGYEAGFTPFKVFLNGSFDILRNGSHENYGETINILTLDYHNGFGNVWENIKSPLFYINRYGWKKFIHQELFPLSLNSDKAQWMPNYGHHIIGSGMLYVKMAEWYDYHEYHFPYLYSFITSTAYQVMNEVLENNHLRGTNVDAIADLLIFNPLGFLLFSFDDVKKFFSETVKLYDWSIQPVFNPHNLHLENAGLQFAFKYQPSFWEKTQFIFYYGIHGLAGISYRFKNEYHISFAGGTVVNRLTEQYDDISRTIIPVTDGAVGIFYDRNNSILASCVISGPYAYNVRLNLYPGAFKCGDFEPGLFVGAGELDQFVFGITVNALPVGYLVGSD
jgi:hypothetical protein